MKTILITVLVSLVLYGQPASRKLDCENAEKAALAAVKDEAELQLARLLVATTSLAIRYQEVRDSQAVNGVEFQLVPEKDWVGTVRSASVTTAVFGLAGFIIMGFASGAQVKEGLLFKLGSGATIGSLALSSVGASVLISSIPRDVKLTLQDKHALKTAVDKGVGDSAAYLAKLLEWSATEKSRFSSALTRKVLSVITHETPKMSMKKENGRDVAFANNLNAKLGEIDFVELIEEEKLAGAGTIEALKAIRLVVSKLSNPELNRAEAKAALGGAHDIQDNVDAIRRIYSLLAKVKKEVTGGAAGREVDAVITQVEAALKTIRDLCEAGEVK